MVRDLLMAEELALIAIKEDTGRPRCGSDGYLRFRLAALLVADLVLRGHARPGDDDPRRIAITFVPAGGRATGSPILAATALVLAVSGPRIDRIVQQMDLGLARSLGHGIWDAVVSGLVEAGLMAPAPGKRRARHVVLDRRRRQDIVDRLSAVALDDEPLPLRTALLLAMAMTDGLRLLDFPRSYRGDIRDRLNSALVGSPVEGIAAFIHSMSQGG